MLTGNDDVKFVYTDQVKSWIYDDDGNFLGVDETNGDIAETTICEFDNTLGVITKATQVSYNDPQNDNDDIRNIDEYSNVSTLDKWLNLPYKTETIDDKNNTRISLKTMIYDSQPEGEVLEGKLSSEILWNNNPSPEAVDEVTSYEYNTNTGNVTKIIYPDGLETGYETLYEPASGEYKQVTKTLSNGLTKITKFDEYGREFESVDIYGDTSTMTFDDYGRIISVTEDINGTPTVTKEFDYSYDDINKLFKVEARYLNDLDTNDFLRVQYFKDGHGRDIQAKTEAIVDEDHCWIVTGKDIYDSMGRIIKGGSTTTANLNNNGYIDIGIIEPSIDYTFDFMGRLTSTTMPSGLIIYVSHDKFVDTSGSYSRILSSLTTSNSEGQEKTVYLDELKREVKTKTKVDSSNYITTEISYDLHGWSELTESDGTSTGEKKLDSLGNLVWMRSPDAGKFEYVYNNKFLVEEVKDYGKDLADPKSIYYSYNSNNKLANINYTGTNNDIYYTYYELTDPGKYTKCNIKSISKGDNTNPYFKVEYNYGELWIDENKTIKDRLGNNLGYNTKYDYDIQGRINHVTYPDNEIVTYSYNEGGYLNRIEGNQVYVENIKYDELRQRIYLKYGNGSEMFYTYDPTTRLLDTFTTKDSSGNEILKYDYDFYITGNISKITDTPSTGGIKSTQNYSYDLVNRLIHADGNYKNGQEEYNRNYEFDGDNRILKKTFVNENNKEYQYHYIADTHAVDYVDILNDSVGNTKIDFNYDDYGNMTKKEILANATSIEHQDYSYDEDNRLSNVDDGAIHVDFKYDNKGQRINKIVEDDLGVLKETIYATKFYTISDGRIDKHISDGNYVIATKIGDDPDEIKYYHQNHIGSTAALTDNNGLMWQEYLFYPYGELWVKDNSVDDSDIDRKFTGQVYDQETGLYYYNARYYDPHIGIFMRPDPARDGINHYAYVEGNPIMYNDPTGLKMNCYDVLNFIDINMKDPGSGGGGPVVGGGFDIAALAIAIYSLFKTSKTMDEMVKTSNDENKPKDPDKIDDPVREGAPKIPENTAEKSKEKAQDKAKKEVTEKDSKDDKDSGGDKDKGEGKGKKNKGAPDEKAIYKDKPGNVYKYNPPKNWNGKPDKQGNYPDKSGDKWSKETTHKGTHAPHHDIQHKNGSHTPVFKSGSDGGSTSGGSGGSGSSSNGSVICTELYNQGLMDFETYKADQDFGKNLAKTNPYVIKGYHFWAKSVVKLMKKSKVVTKIVCVVAMPWANEMAYQMGIKEKGNFAGKIIMKIGIIVCKILGFLVAHGFTDNVNYYLIILLNFLLIYFFVNNEEKKYLNQFIILDDKIDNR